jgi:predicted aspartyl protease
MEIATMGKVLVPAKMENLGDVIKVRDGSLSADQVRTVEVTEALIDTGARTVSFGIYEAVQLTIQGRECVIEVAEVPDDCPPLIGQVPLELLDFVVDPIRQRLIGNPEHGGEHMIEMYRS